MKVPTINSKRARLGVVTVAAIAALAGTSQASHWPQPGGGQTHPGFQVSDPSQLPLPFRRQAGSRIHGSPLVTGGATLADQRIVYSAQGSGFPNPSNTVNLHRFHDASLLASVSLNDPEAPDSDAWGSKDLVAPVGLSGHNSAGQVYAVYNDDDAGQAGDPFVNPAGNDISLAQINATTGALEGDVPLGAGVIPNSGQTNDFTIEAPPAISGDIDGSGTHLIAALVHNADSSARHILLITVPEAASDGDHTADISVAEYGVNIADANVFASPSFVYMRDKGGGRILMIAVPTTDGVKTWRYNNLTEAGAGPSISGIGPTQTITSPVRTDGSPIGLPGVPCPPSPNSCSAPIYVASQTASENTIVRKLKQDESNVTPNAPGLLTLIPADDNSTSPELPGKPARALAVEQVYPTTGAGTNILQPGRVVVGTSKNVYTLDGTNLADDDFARVFPNDRETGFDLTAPSASGGLGFISDNKGAQFVFSTNPADLNEHGSLIVPAEENGFLPAAESLNATSSINQPAISRGRVVFGADNGFFVYGPNVAITKPAANAFVAGNSVPLEAYAYDPNMISVTFYIDGQPITNGTDAIDDDQVFSATWDSKASGLLDGPHTVRADATDGTDLPEGQQSSANRTFILNNYQNPTAALTVTPNPANAGDLVTIDASGSTPTATEAGETIVRWAFELDGDNDYDDVIEIAGSGGDGIITHRFEAGKFAVGVRVTDSHGDVAPKTVNLRVNAPPAANLVMGPNPAAEGQEVTVDASSSTDVDGTITRYEFDLDGNGTFEHDGGANPKVQRVFGPGTTKVSARVTDNEGASSVVSADLVVNAKPANQVPVATFRVTPNPVKPDTRVLFDATGARDPDGTVVKYEWDLDGNGTFETNSQNNPRVQRSYATPKVYNVKLRVTDNLGAVSVDFTGTLTVQQLGRKLPRRLTAKVTPMRDVVLPYDFRTTGRLVRPSGIGKKAGCAGRVTVVVKAGKKTISRRTTRLRSNCTYATSVRFRDRERFGTANALRFTARFQGNKVLRARQATSVRVRVG